MPGDLVIGVRRLLPRGNLAGSPPPDRTAGASPDPGAHECLARTPTTRLSRGSTAFEPDPDRRAELILLGDVKIGWHEQSRLQPNTVEAMNAPLAVGLDGMLRLGSDIDHQERGRPYAHTLESIESLELARPDERFDRTRGRLRGRNSGTRSTPHPLHRPRRATCR